MWSRKPTPVAILALVSSQTGFNHHLRYVLPALPFAFVFLGRLLSGVRPVSSFRRTAAWVLAVCTAVESLGVYPHSASFFNLAIGGPRHGPEHLLDSNISWGQDLLLLRRWSASHPEAAKSLRLAYFGNFDPRVAGIAFELPPLGPTLPAKRLPVAPRADASLGPQPGWHVIDVNLLYGMEQVVPDGHGRWQKSWDALLDLTYFQRFTPVDRIGYSLYVYRIGLEDANRVRHELGLSPWRPPADP